MTRIVLRGVVFATGVLIASLGSTCEDTTPECVPKASASCYCSTGGPGEMVCDDNGLDYGVCVCLPDANLTGELDAAVDAQVTP